MTRLGFLIYCLPLLNVLFTSPLIAAASLPKFRSTVSYSSGGISTARIAAADLNGDGKTDIVVTNGVSNSIGILLGNGDGTFQPAISQPAINSPVGVAIGDVNGDGKPDVLVTTVAGWSKGYGTLQVFLGKGDGTFLAPKVFNAGGPFTYSLTIGDFNRDGKLDVAVADCSPYTGSDCGKVGVLIGRGDGTFKPVVLYKSGGVGTWSVTTADLNEDGVLDLVVGNLCTHAICPSTVNGAIGMLLGREDGTFHNVVTYTTLGRTLVPVIADVNEDGHADVIVTNSQGARGIAVLLGNGDGTLQAPLIYPVAQRFVNTPAVADLNSDGHIDVVLTECSIGDLTCTGSALVGVLFGNGDGTFQPLLKFPSGGVNPVGLALSDVNGDGLADILVANCAAIWGTCGISSGAVGVLVNNTNPTDLTAPTVTVSATPSVLTPPDGRKVDVLISGTIMDTDAGVDPSTAKFVVKDEYGLVQPKGSIALAQGGFYSATVPLEASSLSTDLNGRRYTITVKAQDYVGNTGWKSVIVTVPHE